MGEERLVKSKFLMSVTLMEEITDEEGNKKLKVKDQKDEWVKGKDFTRDMYEERMNDRNPTIQIVNAKPENFHLNVIYIRADGERMWVWVLDDTPTPEEAQAINDAAAGEQQTIESEGEN